MEKDGVFFATGFGAILFVFFVPMIFHLGWI